MPRWSSPSMEKNNQSVQSVQSPLQSCSNGSGGSVDSLQFSGALFFLDMDKLPSMKSIPFRLLLWSSPAVSKPKTCSPPPRMATNAYASCSVDADSSAESGTFYLFRPFDEQINCRVLSQPPHDSGPFNACVERPCDEVSARRA